jgi:hypothetical protein
MWVCIDRCQAWYLRSSCLGLCVSCVLGASSAIEVKPAVIPRLGSYRRAPPAPHVASPREPPQSGCPMGQIPSPQSESIAC